MFLFLFAAIITNACGKNSQKPEIGSMIHPTTAKAKMHTQTGAVLLFFDIVLEC